MAPPAKASHAPDADTWFRANAPSLSPAEEELLTLLALVEPVGLTTLANVASRAGIRDSPSRMLSATTLRTMLLSLIGRGFAREERHGFMCAGDLRTVVMRWAAKRPSLPQVILAAHVACDSVVLQAWVAPFHRPDLALATLLRLEEESREDVETLAYLQLCSSFSQSWLESLPAELRSFLVESALLKAERTGLPLGGLFPFLSTDDGRWLVTSNAFLALAGIAVLRGDLGLLHVLGAQTRWARWAPALRCAIAMIEGRYDDAARDAKESAKTYEKSQHPGVITALQILALGRSRTPDTTLATRKLLALGARGGAPFEGTFKALRVIASRNALPPSTQSVKAPGVGQRATDCLQRLIQSLAMTSDDVRDVVDLYQGLAFDHVQHFAEQGLPWLSQQHHFAIVRLFSLIPKVLQHAQRVTPEVPDPIGPSLSDVFLLQHPWEIALDRLEALAGSNAKAATETAGAERLLWRVHGTGANRSIEPSVQKRALGTGKWTAGRKLALKHLIGNGELRSKLPEEDTRVAAHAHSEKHYAYGYPEVTHELRPGAWLALVGHSRVHLGNSETPIEVVLGMPKITVRSQANGILVALDPPGLRQGVDVREMGGRLVVYSTGAERAPVLATIGAGLTFPASAKAQCLRALDRLAHLMPIDSTEESEARLVPSSATPTFRLVPSQSGLAVSMFVRPLGAHGPHCEPGLGATTLVGAIFGETVRTERQLSDEMRAAAAALAACPVLAGAESGEHAWLVGADGSLELLSSLQTLGDAVAVEWPHGQSLRLRARIDRRALKGSVRRDGGWLNFDASLTVDAGLVVELEELLLMLSESPGRFVRLGNGEFLELEQELREVLDNLAGARADRAGKRRGVSVPLGAVSVLERLGEAANGLVLDAETREWRDRLAAVFAKTFAVPRTLKAELRDYQVEGFRWLARLSDLELGACLADDMGLGKTVELIALLLHRSKEGPALVVAPTSVCDNWRREIERFAPSLRIRSYWGSDRETLLEGLRARDVVLTSYAILQQDADALKAVSWATAILDEAQLIKNAETLRAKAAFGLSARMRIAATGTPIENHVGDLFSIFHFLNPGLLGTWKQFSARMDAGGGKRAERHLIQPFILRRTKTEVLSDLPPLTEIRHEVTLSAGEAALYEAVRKGALAKLGASAGEPRARIQVLAELMRLRRLCCHPELVAPGSNLPSSKLESFLELARELVEGQHRMLVFSQFTDVLALARTLLEKNGITYQYLDGSTPQKKRAEIVEAFQSGEGDAFLISLRAGGFGLNLTAADYVIHLDPWWNPAVESQASDRAHRIGQTRPVTVYRLVTQGTIESRIVELHREKRDLADSILAGTDRAAKLSSEDLRSLLEGSLPIAETSPQKKPEVSPRARVVSVDEATSTRAIEEPRWSVEHYARLVARLSRGENRKALFREANLTEARFEALQADWTARLQKDKRLAMQFVALLNDAQSPT